MPEKKEENLKKIRCSKCNSTFGYLKIKEGVWQCRSCGNADKIVMGEQ